MGYALQTYLGVVQDEFGDFLDQALRDRFVCGVRNEALQRKLLTESDLTIKRAQELAQSMESADLNAKDLKGDGTTSRTPEFVNQVTSFSVLKKFGPCHRCGRRHDWRSVKTREALGTITPFKAQLIVTPNAVPRFHRPRQVPYALKSQVEQELNRLEREGVLKRVNHSQLAAPIVTMPKKDGTVRICGDYKVTVNPVLDIDQYPLPRPEDLFATLAGGKFFSTLDLSHAYNQVASSRRRCAQVPHHQHPSWVVQIYSSSLWCRFSSLSVPEDDGQDTPGNGWGHLLLG